MADTPLTAAEKLKIGEITGIDQLQLQAVLDYYDTKITADVRTYVREQLDAWDLVKNKFTQIQPNAANFGARINPENKKADIRRNISVALYLENGSARLERS